MIFLAEITTDGSYRRVEKDTKMDNAICKKEKNKSKKNKINKSDKKIKRVMYKNTQPVFAIYVNEKFFITKKCKNKKLFVLAYTQLKQKVQQEGNNIMSYFE